MQKETETGTKTISSLQELVTYLNDMRAEGIYVTDVRYTNELTDSDFSLLTDCIPAISVAYSAVGNEYEFTLTPFVGDRIVKAHFSNDLSGLNPEEIEVLRIAEQMVFEAKGMTSDRIELELILHDMLTEKITYYTANVTSDSGDDPPRFRTVTGALLDGRANCMGYSDAFYTLATIAGFEVDRMSVVSDDGMPHMVNTIKLDGAWYVVDVTYDDSDSDTANMYPHFNAGLDMCGSISWNPMAEYRPIAKVSNHNYYYNMKNDSPLHNYQKMHTTLSSLAETAIYEYGNNNRTVIQLMVTNQELTGDEITSAIYEASDSITHAFSYSIIYDTLGGHTYVTVQFS